LMASPVSLLSTALTWADARLVPDFSAHVSKVDVTHNIPLMRSATVQFISMFSPETPMVNTELGNSWILAWPLRYSGFRRTRRRWGTKFRMKQKRERRIFGWVWRRSPKRGSERKEAKSAVSLNVPPSAWCTDQKNRPGNMKSRENGHRKVVMSPSTTQHWVRQCTEIFIPIPARF
jgi:hypothetical protein